MGANDFYWHHWSLIESYAKINSITCGAITSSSNSAPVVTITSPANPKIPPFTPFMLNGRAIDSNGDTITYTWEQINLGGSTGTALGRVPPNNGPLFRSFPPSATGNIRYFPRLATVVTGSASLVEVLPPSKETFQNSSSIYLIIF